MLKLYGFAISQPTRSVKLLLKANAIPYESIVCDVFKGENRKPDFLKISPTGLVPAIVDNDFRMSESSAILQYIAESRKLSSWYSLTDAKARANVNFWLSWHHHNTRYSTKYILTSKLFPKLVGSEENYKLGQRNMTKSAKFLDAALSQHKFLARGDHASIADLLVVTEIDQQMPGAFDLFDFTPFPNITRWVGDVRTATGSDVYDTIYKPVQDKAAALQLKR